VCFLHYRTRTEIPRTSKTAARTTQSQNILEALDVGPGVDAAEVGKDGIGLLLPSLVASEEKGGSVGTNEGDKDGMLLLLLLGSAEEKGGSVGTNEGDKEEGGAVVVLIGDEDTGGESVLGGDDDSGNAVPLTPVTSQISTILGRRGESYASHVDTASIFMFGCHATSIMASPEEAEKKRASSLPSEASQI
jgi:hypothetical protein